VRFGASFFGPGAVGIGLRIPGPRAVD
jgi:hypothetical protein